MKDQSAGHRLAELIRQAMDDLEITGTEYRQIMELANEDGHVDAAEAALLSQFHAMINDGTIKRVAG
jgi:hypothetical protein